MKRMLLALGAFSLAVPAGIAVEGANASAEAKTKRYSSTARLHKVCRKSSGTAGLIAGGAAGAVIGSKVIGGGIVGPAVGAVGGALGGRAVDRTITAKKRCRWVRY